MIKLHHLDQRVYGDFRVTFKSKLCSFYFWLNVSAIRYNKQLEELTQTLGRTTPIHFEEIEEIEETQALKEDRDKIDLVYPEEIAEIKNRMAGEQNENRLDMINEATTRKNLIRDHMDWQYTMTNSFYSHFNVNENDFP